MGKEHMEAREALVGRELMRVMTEDMDSTEERNVEFQAAVMTDRLGIDENTSWMDNLESVEYAKFSAGTGYMDIHSKLAMGSRGIAGRRPWYCQW